MDKAIISIAPGAGDPVGWSVQALIQEVVASQAKAHAEMVERRILAGENEFEALDINGRVNRYLVPGWREHPINRLRIAIARRRYRRG